MRGKFATGVGVLLVLASALVSEVFRGPNVILVNSLQDDLSHVESNTLL